MLKAILSCVLLSGACFVNAAELRHQFVNPNFGGNPFNASPLLNNANAQNGYKDPESASRTSSSAQSFQERLDRAVFSRLSRQLVSNAFSDEEGELQEGTIETGLNTIQVEEVEAGSLITITDNETGETTVIEVPKY